MNIIDLENERLEWSLKNFPEATAESSLTKLIEKVKEVKHELIFKKRSKRHICEEYADCLMCLFDSAGRVGILPENIFKAFKKKLAINKKRTWVKNPDNTYSHVK